MQRFNKLIGDAFFLLIVSLANRQGFKIRGVLPWHNFLPGPTSSNILDFKIYLDYCKKKASDDNLAGVIAIHWRPKRSVNTLEHSPILQKIQDRKNYQCKILFLYQWE
jgi:hypothetical protein